MPTIEVTEGEARIIRQALRMNFRKMDQQEQILQMIRTRKQVWSRELIRECRGWDFRKAITRLRRKGYPIENLSPPGTEARYCWMA